jgi:hypothetical protein
MSRLCAVPLAWNAVTAIVGTTLAALVQQRTASGLCHLMDGRDDPGMRDEALPGSSRRPSTISSAGKLG